MRFVASTVILVAALSLPVSAFAQTAGQPPPGTPQQPVMPPRGPSPYAVPMAVEVPHPGRNFSLTFSPIHLFFPVLELTGEFRISDKVSVAAIVGVGSYSETVNFIKVSATVFEAGAHLRYYVVGDFRHGMQIGAELLYLHLSDPNLSAKGEGLAIGPFVGYKYTADVGFTFDCQLGIEHVGVRASASSGTSSASNSDSSVIPLLNINIGWSFG